MKNSNLHSETEKPDLRSELTGLLGRSGFFSEAEKLIAAAEPGQYCMMAIDIEHFKLFNEWYGISAGDRFLTHIGDFLRDAEMKHHTVAGHIGEDDFGIILPCKDEVIEELQDRIFKYVRQYSGNAGFLPSFGIYRIQDMFVPPATMFDRALIALSMVKGQYGNRSRHYDASMMREMEQNSILLSDVQRALRNGEFTYYLQPKCNMASGKIIGAEALVRWNRPKDGVVLPGRFVPILEKSGFITSLDTYIWEEVCKGLKKWIDLGYRPVPISVNVSRADIFSTDLVEHFVTLVRKYEIPPELLEIEITESFYAEEENAMVRSVIGGLRNAGFTILMDDFGRGYSSLSMLKNINVDILKIDMKFLEFKKSEQERDAEILGTIMHMTRLMSLRAIAEGVEHKEQVDFLLDIGCIYCQGNYFYPPIPVDEFEMLLVNEGKIDYRGCVLQKLNRLLPSEIFGLEAMSDIMLNNILGPVAIYDVCDDNIEILRVNEPYYRLTETDPVELEERRQTIVYDVVREDRRVLLGILKSSREKLYRGSEGRFRRIRGDGTIIWLHIRAFFVREQDGHELYYASLSDVTEYMTAQKCLQPDDKILMMKQADELGVGRKMLAVLHLASINSWEWDLRDNSIRILRNTSLFPVLNQKWFEKEGNYMKVPDVLETVLKEENIPFGYYQAILEFVTRAINNRTGESLSFEFPFRLLEEKIVWLKVVCQTLLDGDGNAAKVIGYYEDISQQKQQKQQLVKMAETDALTGLYNRVTAISKIRRYLSERRDETAALVIFDLDNFKHANDVFGHTFGDYILVEKASRIKKSFRSNDIVCRLGGDEFMVLCLGIPEKNLQDKLTNLIEAMDETYHSDEGELSFAFSAGYVMIPEQGVQFEDLYQKADVALFDAKLNGKGTWKKYKSGMKTVRYELAGKDR